MILTKNTKSERIRLWREQTKMLMKFEPRLRRELMDELRGVGHQAVMALMSGKSLEQAIASHSSHIRAILLKNYRRVGMVVSQGYVDQVSKSSNRFIETKAATDKFRESYGQWMNRWALQKAESISKTTKDKIRQAIIKGEESGDSIDKIASAIRTETGGLLGRSRAVTIARTEVHAAANYSTQEISKSLNIGRRIDVWSSGDDERVRESHAEADGQEISEGELFKVGDSQLQYPGDPAGSAEEIINCRCVVLHRYPDLED